MSEEETQQTQSGSWLDSVSPDFRNDPNISKHDSIESLIKEHVNAQSMLGRKGVILPKEGDADHVVSEFRSALGVPDKAENYSVSGVELPADWDQGLGAQIAQIAHNRNVSQEAFNDIVSAYVQWETNAREGYSQKAQDIKNERINQLKAEWGTAFEANTGLATAALSELTNGNTEGIAQVQLADGTRLGDNPDFIKIMAKVGKNMEEGGLVGGKKVNPHGMTPEEAQRELAMFEADAEKFDILYNQPDHPSHAELVAQHSRLLDMAFPEPG